MGVAIGIVILLFSFILFYKPSWGATVWIYSSEIFVSSLIRQKYPLYADRPIRA
jgi:hypothetical protein